MWLSPKQVIKDMGLVASRKGNTNTASKQEVDIFPEMENRWHFNNILISTVCSSNLKNLKKSVESKWTEDKNITTFLIKITSSLIICSDIVQQLSSKYHHQY